MQLNKGFKIYELHNLFQKQNSRKGGETKIDFQTHSLDITWSEHKHLYQS